MVEQLPLAFAPVASPQVVSVAPSPWPDTVIPCFACGLAVARTVAVLERLGTRLVAVAHAAPCGLPCAAGGYGSGSAAHHCADAGGCRVCGTWRATR